MQGKGLISIIVPIYNVSDYLPSCLDSIIKQTYRNLEIILVDDGSTDNSGEIVDEYAKRDKRIKVIHKKNGGLSDARNVGIESSRGKYIAFIDSDDYIDVDFIQTLYEAVVATESDMSICGYEKVYDGKKRKTSSKKNIPGRDDLVILEGDKKFEELYGKYGNYIVVSWNKLYKRTLFNNIRFPLGKIHEDEFVIHKLLLASKKIVLSYRKLYFYIQRDGSIMSNRSAAHMDIMDAYKDRLQFLENKPYVYFLTLRIYVRHLSLLYVHLRGFKTERKLVKNELKKEYKKLKDNKFLSGKCRLKIFVARYMPHLLFIRDKLKPDVA